MSRRHAAEKREVLPDPKFGDVVLSKFMNIVMYDGKKAVAEKIVYGAIEELDKKAANLRSCAASSSSAARRSIIVFSLRLRAAPMIQRIANAIPRSYRTSTGT